MSKGLISNVSGAVRTMVHGFLRKPADVQMAKEYRVFVDDNYHYMDEEARYSAGVFGSLEEAIEKCREITISSLEHLVEDGITPEQLHAQWLQFGDDPFIQGADTSIPFSARSFVTTERCKGIIESMTQAPEGSSEQR